MIEAFQLIFPAELGTKLDMVQLFLRTAQSSSAQYFFDLGCPRKKVRADFCLMETLHLKACKYALGVRTNTTTDAVYSELGRMSIKSHRHANILKFL